MRYSALRRYGRNVLPNRLRRLTGILLVRLILLRWMDGYVIRHLLSLLLRLMNEYYP